jgi:hypothetical protein
VTTSEKKTKHTPGPWRAEDRTSFRWNSPSSPVNRVVRPIAGGSTHCEIAEVSYPTTNDGTVGAQERAANARLIAASPDMMEALRPFANLAEHRELCERMAAVLRVHERAGFIVAMQQARAALAKAEGAA